MSIATAVMLTLVGLTATSAGAASTAWAPHHPVGTEAPEALESQRLALLPNGGLGGIFVGGPSARAVDLGPDGSVLPGPTVLGSRFDAGGVAESPARTSVVWAERGIVRVVDRGPGDTAFSAPLTVPLEATYVSWISRPDANARGDQVFGYTTSDDDGASVAHIVRRSAGSTGWIDDEVFEHAVLAAVGVSDGGRLVAVLYADEAYWVSTAAWDGGFSDPEWIGDNPDGVSQFVFDVNAPGDALVAWQTDWPDYGQEEDAFLVAQVDRTGAVAAAEPPRGADRYTEFGTAVLDDTGRVTVAFGRAEGPNRGGVLFTATRDRNGAYGIPETPLGLLPVTFGDFALDTDGPGNVVLTAVVSDGKRGVEAVRRSPDGVWDTPQDLLLPCPVERWPSIADVRVRGTGATALMRLWAGGGSWAEGSYVLSHEAPSAAPPGRVCGTPRFAEYSPLEGRPPDVAPSPSVPWQPPRPVLTPSAAPPGGPLVVSLTELRVLGRVTRATRTVRVRAACRRGCELRLRIRPKAGGPPLAATTAFLSGSRARDVALRLPRRSLARWRRAPSRSLQVQAVATWTGYAPAVATRPLTVSSGRR